MRVIKASSIDKPTGLELLNIEPDGSSPYAILSHTWGADGDEVIYTDVLSGTADSRSTFDAKIARTCRRALADGLEYVWVDTCCIDKTSSAELSEAINSMFQWYRSAAICYVLLSDVPSTTSLDARDSAFSKARWFQRGFTLQELIAPAHVIFYSRDWTELGTKADLSQTLAHITRIDADVLTGDRAIESASIANRMGWAADRKTKRPEDIAYCLMGIFGVNMPLLYGEGSKAFIRLQEEIMRSSTDHSLFAWVDTSASDEEMRGVLATSPYFFKHTSMITPYRPWVQRKPYSMTNMGLSIEIVVNQATKDKELFIAGFDCPTANPSSEEFFGIFLKLLDPASQDWRFARVRAGKYLPLSAYEYNEKSHVYLSVALSFHDTTSLPSAPLAQLKLHFARLSGWNDHKLTSFTLFPGVHVHRAIVFSAWPVNNVYLRRGPNRVTCALEAKAYAPNYDRIIILIGTDHNHQPAFSAFNLSRDLDEADFPNDSIPKLDELEVLYQPRPLGETMFLEKNGVEDPKKSPKHGVKVYEVMQGDSRGRYIQVYVSKESPSKFKSRSSQGVEDGNGEVKSEKWWGIKKMSSRATMKTQARFV